MFEDRRKMLVPSALIAAASPGKLKLAKYCSNGYSFMDTALTPLKAVLGQDSKTGGGAEEDSHAFNAFLVKDVMNVAG